MGGRWREVFVAHPTLGAVCWVSGKRHISAKALLMLFFFVLFRSCRASKHRNQQQRQRHFIILCIFSPCIFCIFNAPLYHSTVERGEKSIFVGSLDGIYLIFSSSALCCCCRFVHDFASLFFRVFSRSRRQQKLFCHLKCKQIVRSVFVKSSD